MQYYQWIKDSPNAPSVSPFFLLRYLGRHYLGRSTLNTPTQAITTAVHGISHSPYPIGIHGVAPPTHRLSQTTPHTKSRLHAAQHRLPHQYIARLVLSPVSQPPRATRDNVSSNRICDCDKTCYSTQPPANHALLGREPFFPCPSSVLGRLEPCLDLAFVTGDGSHSMQISETTKSSRRSQLRG